jgi:Acetyltransferase (GNAT) domain
MNITEMFPEASDVFPKHSVDTLSNSYLSEEGAEQLSVEVADSFPAVEALRPIWSKWAHTLETDIDYYLHNLKSDSTVLRPYVITVCHEGIPQAMLVGQIRRRRVSSVVSFVNITGPKVKVLEMITGGRIGRQSAAIDKLLVRQLSNALRNAEVDLLCFQRLPLQSDLFRELQQVPGLLMKERVPQVFCYSVVPLTAPPGKRARALSGKNRREVRRKTRILQRAFPGNARFKCFSDPSELDAGLRDAATVDGSTWQHYLGYGLLNTPHARENLAFCVRRGWLRIYVMYVEDSPVAFLIGQHYRQTFYCQHAGYRLDFARYSVGSLLTTWVLESLAAAGVEQVDLGEGGQEHNRRLGCDVRQAGTVHLYSSTLRGLCANVFFAVTHVVRAGGRYAREGLRLNHASGAWSRFLLARSKTLRTTSEAAAEIR